MSGLVTKRREFITLLGRRRRCRRRAGRLRIALTGTSADGEISYFSFAIYRQARSWEKPHNRPRSKQRQISASGPGGNR